MMSEPLNQFINTGLDDTLAKSYAATAGLVQVLTNVSGKHGMYQRLQWVRPDDAAKQVMRGFSHTRDGQGKPIKPMFMPLSESSQSSMRAFSIDDVVKQYTKTRTKEPLQDWVKNNYFVSDGSSQTKEYYNRTGEYTEERKKLHNRIVNQIVSEAGEPKEGEKPVCILLGGGSSSGKSTIRDVYIEPELDENDVKVATVDSDAIKEELPEYAHFKRQDVESAAFRIHQESADVAEQAIDTLISKGKHFIYDGTMKSLSKYEGLISKLKEAGYTVKIVVADVPLDIAMERSQKRAEKTGRKVPKSIIEGSHGGCSLTFPKIAHLADEFELYDNSGSEPILVQDNHETYEPELYDAFIEKGKEYQRRKEAKRR